MPIRTRGDLARTVAWSRRGRLDEAHEGTLVTRDHVIHGAPLDQFTIQCTSAYCQ